MANFTPVSAAIGGALIGLSAALLMLLIGRVAGISGIFGGCLRFGINDKGWRIAFIAGLILAPLIASWIGYAMPSPQMPALIAALVVTVPGFMLAKRRERPILATQCVWPTKTRIDRPLVIGSALFGTGWGLVGLCPGPALENLATLSPRVIAFVVAMAGGMAPRDFWQKLWPTIRHERNSCDPHLRMSRSDSKEPMPMSKNAKKPRDPNGRAGYKASLRNLQVELVKVQRHVIKHGHRVLVIFEGRDASGKDGTIKRIVQHLSPRETRVVALGKPSDKERASWYFQRYVAEFAGGAGTGPVQSQLVKPGGRRTGNGVLHGQ